MNKAASSCFTVQFGQEVGDGNVDEKPRGKGGKLRKSRVNEGESEITKDGSHGRCQSRCQVVEENFFLAVAGVEKHAEVGDLLWDFVKKHRECCGNANGNTDCETQGDNKPVNEVMHRVAQKNRARHDAPRTVFQVVAMVPEEKPLKEVSGDDADKRKKKQRLSLQFLGRLGQEVKESGAEKRADGETQEEE